MQPCFILNALPIEAHGFGNTGAGQAAHAIARPTLNVRQVVTIQPEVRGVLLKEAAAEIGGNQHAKVPVPEGGGIPLMMVPGRGEEIGETGLRAGIGVAFLCRGGKEINGSQVFEVLRRAIVRGELQ